MDGLALGFAQAAALAPGISRNGATLTVARSRGFTRQHANMLSRTVALPVIVGAGLLKGLRLRRRGLPAGEGTAFATGTAASFASTLASQALIRVVERDSALWPYAAYRAGLAGMVLGRLLRDSRRRRAALRGFGRPDGVAPGDRPPALGGNGAPTWVSTPGSGAPSREEPR
jgi:undecaprenyl-diphosphatase